MIEQQLQPPELTAHGRPVPLKRVARDRALLVATNPAVLWLGADMALRTFGDQLYFAWRFPPDQRIGAGCLHGFICPFPMGPPVGNAHKYRGLWRLSRSLRIGNNQKLQQEARSWILVHDLPYAAANYKPTTIATPDGTRGSRKHSAGNIRRLERVPSFCSHCAV